MMMNRPQLHEMMNIENIPLTLNMPSPASADSLGPHIDRSTIMRLRQNAKDELEISNQSHCCTKTLAELKPIQLAQMKVPFVHEGHFLACRVPTESIVAVGL
jgi:hypothetical protein